MSSVALICNPTNLRPWITNLSLPILYPRQSGHHSARPVPSEKSSDTSRATEHYPYAVQLVTQVNYGPLKSKRYFVPQDNPARDFVEVTVEDLVNANFEKVNSYKNFKCLIHNKFFEVNLYQKDPVNMHYWRATISRPAEEIDIPAKPKEASRPGSFHLSQHLPNKNLAQGMEQQHVSPWKKLLSAGEIARFIIDCGHGYELFASAELEPLIRALVGDIRPRG